MKNVKLLCSLFAAFLLSGSMWATQVNVATTAELQSALDNATEGTEIIVAAGTYDVVKLQNNGANANRIMKDVTIKAATGATVKIAQIAYQRVSGKSLDIENLTIDGFEFNVPEKTGVLFNENVGYLRVNGLTVQNCKKVGNKSEGSLYDNAAFFGGYYDGATNLNATFNGYVTLTRGYHDIKILNNTIEKVLQPIKFPNDGPLYGLTVTGNSFIDCQDNHFMLSTKTTGTVTITDNTIDQMTGRFARISGAQADAKFYFSNNKITKPQMYDTGGDGSIVKITGTSGFSIETNSGNDWIVKTNEATTWITIAPNVAKIGTTEYATLAAAIEAVQDGETITIISDIDVTGWVEINKPAVAFTIDLNGKKIERTNGSVFDIYSKVTFKDSQTGGTIKAAGRGLYCNAGADCTLESGKVIGTDGSAVNIYGAYGTGVAKFTMNGGSITAEDEQGLYVSAETQGAEFVMNGGTITAVKNTGIACWGNNTEDALKITINAGTIIGAGSYALTVNGSESGAKVTIVDGTFTCDGGCAMYMPYQGNTTISGGTFTGTEALVIKGGNVSISGGTFIANGTAIDPSSAVQSGYAKTGDAIYVEDNYGKQTDATPKFDHNITLNITGGVFTSTNANALSARFSCAEDSKVPAQITISGGRFMSATDKAVIYTANDFAGSIVASAGVYNLAPAQEFIIMGKVAIANTDEETKVAYPWMIGIAEEVTDGTGKSFADATAVISSTLAGWKESTPTTLTIKRNIYKDGYYNTLCLPFALTNEQIVATFGAYKELKKFISAEVQGEGASREIILNLKDTTGIKAGEAYLITFENGTTLTELVFSGVTVTTTTATAESGDLVYQGILAPYQMPYNDENYLFVGEQNKLYWAIDDGTFMKGFRAYFKVDNTPKSPYRFGMKASFGSKNTPTGNANVNANASEIKKLIENGRVFIMNNGVKYDMNGKVVE